MGKKDLVIGILIGVLATVFVMNMSDKGDPAEAQDVLESEGEWTIESISSLNMNGVGTWRLNKKTGSLHFCMIVMGNAVQNMKEKGQSPAHCYELPSTQNTPPHDQGDKQ